MSGPADTVEQRESVSIAMLTLMERLSARERVVYVLREAFGYAHNEIAEIVDLTESNCYQIYRRAKQHMADDRPAARSMRSRPARSSRNSCRDAQRQHRLAGAAADRRRGERGRRWWRGDVAVRIGHRRAAVARFLRRLFEPTEHKWEQIGGRA
ncbi:sigma factor-like helix-turn-helix DNA-binding protein [Nocardia spumae]|uniref:sigma factor-like helix-turn-helix DNA-binding protein n=1 Tax=Nocardia spumae TaxID=2887190 RepID=UPI0027E1C7B4|nr:sigma factor-like helix-turn-helix DNA-binding protein [Nocardia spumae]